MRESQDGPSAKVRTKRRTTPTSDKKEPAKRYFRNDAMSVQSFCVRTYRATNHRAAQPTNACHSSRQVPDRESLAGRGKELEL
jgi:hypothetical protein